MEFSRKNRPRIHSDTFFTKRHRRRRLRRVALYPSQATADNEFSIVRSNHRHNRQLYCLLFPHSKCLEPQRETSCCVVLFHPPTLSTHFTKCYMIPRELGFQAFVISLLAAAFTFIGCVMNAMLHAPWDALSWASLSFIFLFCESLLDLMQHEMQISMRKQNVETRLEPESAY